MSSDNNEQFNNWWLYKQLRDRGGLELIGGHQPLITVRHKSKTYRIYSPKSEEYIVTVDIVEKVREMGGNLISYPTTWCRASKEAVAHGKTIGVDIVPHGALFAMLK